MKFIIKVGNSKIYISQCMQLQKPKQSQILTLRNGNYYYLVNPNKKMALTVPKSTHYGKEDMQMKPIDQNNISQIWMVEEIQPHRYQIVHAMSALVLENQGKAIKLHHGKWKQNQLYYFEKSDPIDRPNYFYIKQSIDSVKYLIFDDQLRVKQKKNTDSLNLNDKWELILINNHKILDKTCIIESPHSSLVLDVPEASQKQSTQLIQFSCNKRFNQRWEIIKEEKSGFYYIKVFRNDLVLDVKGASKKEGASIIQYHQQPEAANNQLWLIQQQGKRLYFIRSAMDLSLLMGVSGNSLKEGAQIVTTKTQSDAFWRIVGYVPI